jgi:hypothetical protein
MKRIIQVFAIAALAGGIWFLGSSEANAGHTGGPGSWTGIIPANRTVADNISFDAGSTAVITATGSTTSNIYLVVTDSLGNRWTGSGVGPVQTVRIQVTQTGLFNVTILNGGPEPIMYVLRTN